MSADWAAAAFRLAAAPLFVAAGFLRSFGFFSVQFRPGNSYLFFYIYIYIYIPIFKFRFRWGDISPGSESKKVKGQPTIAHTFKVS